jgi:hypothetical protein
LAFEEVMLNGLSGIEASVELVKNKKDQQDGENERAKPQNDHRRKAGTRPLASGLEPTEVILM